MALQQGEDGDRELYNSLFRCLQKPARRRILFGLIEKERREPLAVPEDVHTGEKKLETLQVELAHNHLPMLQEAGLIRWDRTSHHLYRGPRFDVVRELLNVISDHDPILRE